MNLIVDIGNTRTKLTFFQNNSIKENRIYSSEKVDLDHIIDTHKEKSIIVSSVKNFDQKLKKKPSILHFNNKTPLPISNAYKSEEIGMDRLASAVGAFELFPNKNCLIIDLGSAITVDFLSEQAVFKGGNISLGLNFRFKALHNFTSKLPLVNEKGNIQLTSDNTNDAIRSGIIKSIVYELEGYIQEYEKSYPNLEIILTGGDSNFFAKQLKKRIFANENLVAIGLNRILRYNVKKI